jgi:apolipoprotein N-acyltransferase
MKKILELMPAIVSGLLVSLSFPRFDLSFLAWFAFIPFLLSLFGKTPGRSFSTGFVFGLAYFFPTLYWIYNSISVYGGLSHATSLGVVFLLCLYLSLYPALFASAFTSLLSKTKLPALLIAPVVWVVLEFLRSYALTGFPWASIGYSQYRFLHLIQFADITGVYGVSFLVLAVNGAVVDIFLLKRRIQDMPLFPLSYTIVGFSVLMLLVAAAFGYGSWRLSEVRPGRSVSVSVVQGNIEQDKKWEPAYQQEVLNTYFSQSGEAASSSPRLIVWPETAVPFFFGTDRDNTEKLIAFQQTLNAYLLFGSVLVKERSPERTLLTNSAVLLDPTGKAIYKYDKIHLVPFGEYVPLRSVLFFVDKLVAGIGDYVPGDSYVKAGTEFGDFGTLVCYEIIFPGLVRKFYTKGGDLMVTITNDAWFGRTSGPYQHFSMAVFRAVENRKPVVRAANTGVSGFIDSNGMITARTPLFERRVLTQKIRTDHTMTFYTKYGDLFSYLCMVIFIILSINVRIWR